jgi:arabinan endo-1,5-alpha-L-arabinosidase
MAGVLPARLWTAVTKGEVMRIAKIAGLGCTGLLLLLAGARTRADDWALTGNVGAHDPTIVKEGSTWWVATTGAGAPIKYSSDGRNWIQGVRRFPAELSWWRSYAPNMGANDVWAPDVRAYGGRVWMYYSVSEFGRNNSAIGLTSASSIAAGDWRDDGLVLSSRSGAQSFNAIDPHLAVDAAGAPWLVFGSWFSGIHLTRLDPGTMKPTGTLTRIAARSGGIEAPNVVYANGFYYLFVSFDTCCQGVNSTYKIAYGRSGSITGPYLDRNGVDMSSGGGTILEASSGRYVGPGGQSVVQVGSSWVLVRHYYDANANGAPKLRIGDLYWDAGGWPTLTRPGTGGTTYTLSVTKAGTGGGAVTSSPSGIACGATCSSSFPSGTSVTLGAAAAAGSTFAGWGGACTGTGSCSTTMTAARSVTATFNTTPGGTTPCASPVTFTGQSGNFGTTGAICLRTASAVNGWGCSNFAGRTVSVNGGTATGACGGGPLPLAKQSDGYTYFSVTAGAYPWASMYTW